MKIAWRITRTAHLLGAAGVALLLVGCADQQPTGPTAKTVPAGPEAIKLLDLSGKPDLHATVTTVSTFRDKTGKVHQKRFTQRVKASFKRGLARASLDVASASSGTRAMFAGVTDAAAFAQYTDDPSILTPILAATSGTLAYNYADSQTDSVGNKFEIYGWAPSEGTPITDAWGYTNGILVARYHANWTPVAGGYVLADQTLGSYQQDGTLAGTIVSTITGGGGDQDPIQKTNNESFGERLGALSRLALDQVGCWLAPESAYASVPCVRQGLVFGGETYAMGVATYTGLAFAWPGAYFTGWGLWTDALINFLECVDASGATRGPRGGGVCNTNKKAVGCGSGGGGGGGLSTF